MTRLEPSPYICAGLEKFGHHQSGTCGRFTNVNLTTENRERAPSVRRLIRFNYPTYLFSPHRSDLGISFKAYLASGYAATSAPWTQNMALAARYANLTTGLEWEVRKSCGQNSSGMDVTGGSVIVHEGTCRVWVERCQIYGRSLC